MSQETLVSSWERVELATAIRGQNTARHRHGRYMQILPFETVDEGLLKIGYLENGEANFSLFSF